MKRFLSFHKKGQKLLGLLLAIVTMASSPLLSVQAIGVKVLDETEPVKTIEDAEEKEPTVLSDPLEEGTEETFQENALKVFGDLSEALRAAAGSSAARYKTTTEDFTENEDKTTAWSKQLDNNRTMFGDKYVTPLQSSVLANQFTLTMEAGLEDPTKRINKQPAPGVSYVAMLIDQSVALKWDDGNIDQLNGGTEAYFNAIRAENSRRMEYARSGVYTDIDPKGNVEEQMKDHLIRVLFTAGYNEYAALRFDSAEGLAPLTQAHVDTLVKATHVTDTLEHISNEETIRAGKLRNDARIGEGMEFVEKKIDTLSQDKKDNLYLVVASMFNSTDFHNANEAAAYLNQKYGVNHPNSWYRLAFYTNLYCSGYPGFDGGPKYTAGTGKAEIQNGFAHVSWNINQMNWYLDAARRIKEDGVTIQAMVVNATYQVDMMRNAVKAKDIELLNTYWFSGLAATCAGLSSSDYQRNGHLGATSSLAVPEGSGLSTADWRNKVIYPKIADFKGFKTPEDFIAPDNIFGLPANFLDDVNAHGENQYGSPVQLYYDWLRAQGENGLEGVAKKGYAYDYDETVGKNQFGYYTYLPEDAASMIASFQAIATQQGGGKNDGGYASGAAMLEDQLTDVFTIPMKRDDVRVYKVPRVPAHMDENNVPTDMDENGRSADFTWGQRSYLDGDNATLSDWVDITDEVGLQVTEDNIRVSGFNYEMNALTDFNKYGRDHYEPGDYGWKIVIEASITAKETFGGNGIRTNTDASITPSIPGDDSGLPEWKDNTALNPSGSEVIEHMPVPVVDLQPTNPYQAIAETVYVYAPQTAPAHNIIMDDNQNIFYNDPLYDMVKAEADALYDDYEKASKAVTEYVKQLYGDGDEPGEAEGELNEEQQTKLDELSKTAKDLSRQWTEKLEQLESCIRCVPDGHNNQFVDIDYTLKDPDGKTIATMHIPRGRGYDGKNIEWDFSPMGSDKKLTESGIYTVTVQIRPVASNAAPNFYIYSDTDTMNMTPEQKNDLVGSNMFYQYHSEQYSTTGSRVDGEFKGTDVEAEGAAYLYQLHVTGVDSRLVPKQTIDFIEGMEPILSTKNPHVSNFYWACTDGKTPSEPEREPGVTGELIVGRGGVNLVSTIPERAFNEGKAQHVNSMTACGDGDGYEIPILMQLQRECGNLDKKVSVVTQTTQVTKFLSDTDNIFGNGKHSVIWDHDCSIVNACDENAFANAQDYGDNDSSSGTGKTRALIHVEDNPMPDIEKSTTTPVITRGEEMLWQVSVENTNAEKNPKKLPAQFTLADVLPYNGDGLVDPLTNREGSDFADTLQLTSLSLGLSKFRDGLTRLESGADAVYYTTDKDARDASEADLRGESDKITWVKADTAISGTDANVLDIPENVTAIRYDTTLPFGASAILRFATNVENPEAQKMGDRYHNQAVVTNLRGGHLSEVVAVCMTPTQISGKIWEDTDGNSLIGTEEPGIKDVVVTLYQEWTSKNPNPPDRVIDGVKLVRVYNLEQDALPSQVTGEDGNYLFEEVNPGTYYIVADGIPEQYSPAKKQAAKDDPDLQKMDSECEEKFGSNTDENLNQTAVIKKLTVGEASVDAQNFGMQKITGTLEVTKLLDEIYFPSSMTDAEREDYQLVFTFSLQNEETGREYAETVRISQDNFDTGEAKCTFKDLPLGTYFLTEKPQAQYILDSWTAEGTGLTPAGKVLQVDVTPAVHEFSVTANNKMAKDPPGGDENGVANFVNVRVPVSLEVQYDGPDPIGNKEITKYAFTADDFKDIIVTYDDGTSVSLKEGTLRFADVTFSPAEVTNLMNTKDGKKLTVNAYYSEKGRVVKDNFQVGVDLKPVHKFKLTFDANGSTFETGSTKNIVNFAYDENAGCNIVTSGVYRDVANGGLHKYGASYGFAG